LVPLAICGVLAGCGGASRAHVGTGAALFAAKCGACHSLSGRESPGRQGGDLLHYRFTREVMLEFAREMPVRRPLDARELNVVAAYLVGVERGNASR
jgi:mono/diheme cytochrome c family protein